MEDNKYEQLKKDVNYMNEEQLVPEGAQLRVYRNADELIQAIRNNEIPNIPWTEEDEVRYQLELTLEHKLEETSGSIEKEDSDVDFWEDPIEEDETYFG